MHSSDTLQPCQEPDSDELLEDERPRSRGSSIALDLRREMAADLGRASRADVLRRELQWLEGELGDAEDGPLRERLAGAALPAAVRAGCRLALQRLHGDFGEAMAARAYLQFVAGFPWRCRRSARAPERAEAAVARHVWGGGSVRERMADLCHQRRDRPTLCFSGPPGVGKTYLAERLAESMGLPFAVVNLGGMRGDAPLRGVAPGMPGAAPGAVLEAIARAGSRRCVVLLDDIDKIEDPDGNIWAALLELLDPNERGRFIDRYLGHAVDLSRAWFIVAANEAGRLPAALSDRLEVVLLRGYDDEEKKRILRERLWPRALRAVGAKLGLAPEAIEVLLDVTADELGVRNLERACTRLLRRWVRAGLPRSGNIDGAAAARLLKFQAKPLPADIPGRVLGLAWTPMGGTVMPIEVAVLPAEGGVRATGSIGDVMGESLQTVYAWLRIHAAELGLPHAALARAMHVHFPEAATPKDGPSAGLTLLAGILSAAAGRVLAPRAAYMGEITLLGEVLGVGGVREKLLAALRAGVRTVFLPAANRRDAETLSLKDRQRLELRFVTGLGSFAEELLGSRRSAAA